MIWSYLQTLSIARWFLAVCLATLLFSCGEAPNQDIIRFGLANAPSNFDPRFATDATSARLNRLLYDRLVDFDEASQPIPALADWKQVSPTHYRFHLRPTRQPFHDGSPLTSHDVKATYQFILNPDNASPHRSPLRLITRIETPTTESIDFYLSQPDILFPHYLVIGILPEKLIQADHPFHEQPIGSGPFAFVQRSDDTRWRFVRHLDGQLFEMIRIGKPTVRALKLLAGEIDMLQNDLPPEIVVYLSQDTHLNVQRHRGSNFSYLGFNMRDPVVGQLQVRQAIAHAIDRDSIIQYVFQGTAYSANALLPPDHWAGLPVHPGYSYDQNRARALLHEAGVDKEHPIEVVYKTSTDPFRLRLATILQQQLDQVGIHTTIQSHDWGTFYGDIKAGHFQMYSLAWVGLKTPDIFNYAFHSHSIPPNGANRGRFMDETSDRLIQQAQVTQNLKEKQDTYRTLQAHLLQSLPYIPLWFEDHTFISRANITGYSVSPDGNYDGLLKVKRSTGHPHKVVRRNLESINAISKL